MAPYYTALVARTPLAAGGAALRTIRPAGRRITVGALAARLPFRACVGAAAGLPFRIGLRATAGLPLAASRAAAFCASMLATGRLACTISVCLPLRLPFRLALPVRAALAFTACAAGWCRAAVTTATARALAETALLGSPLRLQACDLFHRNAAPDEVLDAADLVTFGMGRKGVSLTIAACATRPADTVDVVFGLHGQVVIEGV